MFGVEFIKKGFSGKHILYYYFLVFWIFFYIYLVLLLHFDNADYFISFICSDGTLPSYNLHQRYGSGVNSWLINLKVLLLLSLDLFNCSALIHFIFL